MVTTVQHGDNPEMERLGVVVQELENKINSLSKSFDALKRENTYKDEQIKLLQAGVDAKIAALNNHAVRGDGRDKVWAKMAELDDIIDNPKKLSQYTLVDIEIFYYMLDRIEKWLESHHDTKLYYDNKLRASDPGNRSKLKPRHALLLYLYSKRSKDPGDVIGGWFGLNRTNAARQCNFMEQILSYIMPTISNVQGFMHQITSNEEFFKFARTIMLDGTLITAHMSNDKDNPETSGYSGKIKDSGFNTLAACNEDGLLVYMSGTYSGNHHDYSILKENPIDLGLYSMAGGPNTSTELMQKILLYADRGFIGMEKDYPDIAARVPYRGKDKKSSREIKAAYKTKDDKAIAYALGLTIQQYKHNKEVSSVRSLVERVFANLKKYGALSGPHIGTASELNRTFDVIGGIHNLEIILKNPDKYDPILDYMRQRVESG